jgi:TolB-like protein/AraC-like DNA-binding protein
MEKSPSMDDQFLSTINKIIEDNLDNENFSVEDLAQQARLSRSMLHRKLIKLTGKSATDLITEIRLIHAKELLENDVATVSEIAYKVGFSSPSYFDRLFKKHFKVSPGDIRKGVVVHSDQPYTYQKKKIPALPGQKLFSLRNVVLIIILVIVIAGVGIYYISREKEPSEKSIAILPFENLSTNAENQFFADGIVEDLLYRLSSINELKVISRTSSEMFRNKGNKTSPEIADILGVNYILEGSVQRESDNIRISVQLIDAQKDDHILSKQYDRELSEFFKIQSEIAGQIASELSLALTERQTDELKQKQTNSLKAFEYMQLGRYHLNKRTPDDLYASVKYLSRAIAEDPDYALAYALLANAYHILGWYDYIDRQTGRDSAEYLSLKALSMDENIGEAHNVLGEIYYDYDWNYTLAEKEFKKALAISPNNATTYRHYGELMTILGNLGKAREFYDKAIQLDPYSYIIRFGSSYAYFREKKYEQALIEYKICQGLAKDNPGPIKNEFFIHVITGNTSAALESYKKYGMMTGMWTPDLADSLFYAEGINGLVKWRLKIGNWSWRIGEAHYYALLGEKDKALDILEQALKEGYLVPFNTADPEFENLHSEPRFIAIRGKMGLPPLQ